AEIHQRRNIVDQDAVGGLPVDPGDLVVLRIGVVVALLGAPHLVALLQQRHPARQQQRRQQRPHVALAGRDDGRVVGFALAPAVPRGIVVVAVAIILAIGLVV